jgi:hypothetical protein
VSRTGRGKGPVRSPPDADVRCRYRVRDQGEPAGRRHASESGLLLKEWTRLRTAFGSTRPVFSKRSLNSLESGLVALLSHLSRQSERLLEQPDICVDACVVRIESVGGGVREVPARDLDKNLHIWRNGRLERLHQTSGVLDQTYSPRSWFNRSRDLAYVTAFASKSTRTNTLFSCRSPARNHRRRRIPYDALSQVIPSFPPWDLLVEPRSSTSRGSTASAHQPSRSGHAGDQRRGT